MTMGLTVNSLGGKPFFPLCWKLLTYFAVFMLLIVFIGLYINIGLKMSSRFFKTVLDENKRLEESGKKVKRNLSVTLGFTGKKRSTLDTWI